ncbi:hypothetical protein [Pseudonocardia broussonetiae]|uniref:Glycosyltransferase n=1 Tax=Pseudonocardia broussonetiae TaxID=2736640 RepID=A0A6M6JIT5_9PSEU|nr:hypothetical protein [Pseudonocardia broussonetiae]QJY47948.1 hypothetical protein HOP40_20880 [Pseudonocardia broussonetiae]
MDVVAYMISCSERADVRAGTLARLAATDWAADAVVVLDGSALPRPQDRQVETAERLLRRALSDGAPYVLFLEDDLEFNRYLRHNLESWWPLRTASPDTHFMASLYNPDIGAVEEHLELSYAVADPDLVYGSQAFLLSRATVARVIDGWYDVIGGQDIKISRLAATAGPIHYHRPSLVQHVPVPSTWGGVGHTAIDYSPTWLAS